MRYLAVLSILATPAMAFGQDSSFLGEELSMSVQGYTDRQDYFAARVSGSLPAAGMAFEDADGGNVSYDDILRPGISASVEWGILFRSPNDYWTGGYISLGTTSFSGQDHTDSAGRLEVNDFKMVSAIAGIRVLKWGKTGTSIEGFLGVGWMRYSSLDGKIAGIPGDVEIFNRTPTTVGEAGVRMGWGDNSFSLQAGLSGRVARGPRLAGQFANISGNGNTMLTLQLQFGVQVGF